MIKFCRVTIGRDKFWLKVTSENDLLIWGTEVNSYGDEVIPRGVNAVGKRFTDRARIIEKKIAKIELAHMNLKYAMLEVQNVIGKRSNRKY